MESITEIIEEGTTDEIRMAIVQIPNALQPLYINDLIDRISKL